MPKPRDTQRSKLYTAEDVALSPRAHNVYFESLAECQAYADKVLSSAFVQSRWGKVSVKIGRGKGGRGMSYGGYVTLGTQAQTRHLILHELAHELNRRSSKWSSGGAAAHGPEYAAVLLVLVENFIDQAAASRLRHEYSQFKVKYRTGMASIPAAGSRAVVTKAAVAAKKRAANERPVSADSRRGAADIIRRLARKGVFGPTDRVAHSRALATARVLEGSVEAVSPPARTGEPQKPKRLRVPGHSLGSLIGERGHWSGQCTCGWQASDITQADVRDWYRKHLITARKGRN